MKKKKAMVKKVKVKKIKLPKKKSKKENPWPLEEFGETIRGALIEGDADSQTKLPPKKVKIKKGLKLKQKKRKLKEKKLTQGEKRKLKRRIRKLTKQGFSETEAMQVIEEGGGLDAKLDETARTMRYETEAFRMLDNKKGRIIKMTEEEQEEALAQFAEESSYYGETLERSPEILGLLCEMSWFDLRTIYNLIGEQLLPFVKESGIRQGLLGRR